MGSVVVGRAGFDLGLVGAEVMSWGLWEGVCPTPESKIISYVIKAVLNIFKIALPISSSMNYYFIYLILLLVTNNLGELNFLICVCALSEHLLYL